MTKDHLVSSVWRIPMGCSLRQGRNNAFPRLFMTHRFLLAASAAIIVAMGIVTPVSTSIWRSESPDEPDEPCATPIFEEIVVITSKRGSEDHDK